MKKIKGWRELVKDEEVTQITEADIREYFKDIFKDLPKRQDLSKYPKHYTWVEDGQECSMWEIYPGMCTGDQGYENYCNSLKEQSEDILKSIKF